MTPPLRAVGLSPERRNVLLTVVRKTRTFEEPS